MQKGRPVNLPLTVNLHIEAFAAGVVTRAESASTNMVYDQYADGRWYATQRPGINQFEDASASGGGSRGRGAYYWDAVSDKYICNSGSVIKSSYAGTAMSITNGTQRVYIEEVGVYLVVIDQENNEGWYINSSAPTTINAISDVNFPGNIAGKQLARGGAVLNGKMYLGTTDGDIYECDIEDPTTWRALAFREAEVEPDGLVVVAKHYEHIVALGTRTCEFFQDVANPTGSTLAARTDIHHTIGAVDVDSHAQIGENLYFVGQDKTGAIGAYMLEGLQLRKVSGEDLDTFLTSAITVDSMGMMGSGFVSGGRAFYMLTPYNTITDIMPASTLVYVSRRQWWGFWDVQLPDVDYMPLVQWIPATTTRAGEGILSNGDLVTVTDDFNPVDTVNASAVYESGVFEPGVFTATGGSGTAIPFESITGVTDGGIARRKTMGDLWLQHTPISADETVDIAVADEQTTTYGTARALSVNDPDARLNRMGSFRRRNFKVSGALTEQIKIENLQTTVRVAQ